MSYLGNAPGVASQRVESSFTATAGQTVFTPVAGYTIGYCDVFLNGVKLVNGDDYTAADGVTVVLASGAAAGDTLEVLAYFPRGLTDGYTKPEADGRFAPLVTGNLFLPANPGSTRTLGMPGSSNTTLIIQGGASSGSSANLELTSTNHFYADANVTRFRTQDATTTFGEFSSLGLRVPTGNVGIGVDATTKLTVGRVDTSSEGGQIDLCRASDNTSAWAIDVFGNTSTPSLRLVDNVAALTRMQIDGAGRVTMPYQPAFMAVRSANHVTSSGVIVFENVRHNVGGHYNSSNGRFTAPVSGVYVFGMTCLLYSMGNSSNVNLNVNGSSFDGHGFFGVYGQFSGSYAGQGATLSVKLNAGDYVEFYYSNNGTHLHNGYTKAFGHLLG